MDNLMIFYFVSWWHTAIMQGSRMTDGWLKEHFITLAQRDDKGFDKNSTVGAVRREQIHNM